jgi:transcription antitermination factor NusG
MIPSLDQEHLDCEKDAMVSSSVSAEDLSSRRFEEAGISRKWYAVYTLPQNERSVARHLRVRQIESFLPTYERTRIWKNRQRIRQDLPLFPSYLFVRICAKERSKLLQSPGVLQIVGSGAGPVAIPDDEIEFLQSDFCKRRVEPCHQLVIGKRARIKNGTMRGVCGVLVQKRNNLRFVVTLELIHQHVAVEVAADDLELIPV